MHYKLLEDFKKVAKKRGYKFKGINLDKHDQEEWVFSKNKQLLCMIVYVENCPKCKV